MGCCSSTLISSHETEDVSLVRSAFKSLDESYNANDANNSSINVHEFELKLKKYKTCFGIEAINQLKCYTIWNIITWMIICSCIWAGAIYRYETLKKHEYTQYCCACYNYGVYIETFKVDFSYCMDTTCNCEDCRKDVTYARTTCPNDDNKWDVDDCDEIERKHLSVSSWEVFPKSYWAFYGFVVFVLGLFYSVFMVSIHIYYMYVVYYLIIIYVLDYL